MIEVKNVVKVFDGFRALDEISINVPKGAIYGLVGPNGAGKSTLIRHLAGIYRQNAGEILIDGQPVYENPDIKSAASRSAAISGRIGVFLIRIMAMKDRMGRDASVTAAR